MITSFHYLPFELKRTLAMWSLVIITSFLNVSNRVKHEYFGIIITDNYEVKKWITMSYLLRMIKSY